MSNQGELNKIITAQELNEILSSGEKIQIIDVREPYEWDICHIEGAQNIPMNLIDESLDKISKDHSSVVMCHHGMRSMSVIHYLKMKGFNKLINLEGGIHAWANEVDKNMETY